MHGIVAIDVPSRYGGNKSRAKLSSHDGKVSPLAGPNYDAVLSLLLNASYDRLLD